MRAWLACTVKVTDRGEHDPETQAITHDPARAPAMGQAYDFSSQQHPRSASIEVASAEALRILQRHYGATTEGKGKKSGLDGGGGIDTSFSASSSWLQLLPWCGGSGQHDDAPQNAVLVKQCACLSLAAPIVVLGPWLNVVLASLIRGLASSAGPRTIVRDSAVAMVGMERGMTKSVGWIVVSFGLLAVVLKLLCTAPCIGAGWALLDRLLPRCRDGERVAQTGATSVVDAEAGGVGKGNKEHGEMRQGKSG